MRCAVATEALFSKRSNQEAQDPSCTETGETYLSVPCEDANHERPPAMDSDDDQFEVERLIKKRRFGKGIQYLVKWRGYPDSENTWEKTKDIHPSMVAAFEVGLVDGSEPSL